MIEEECENGMEIDADELLIHSYYTSAWSTSICENLTTGGAGCSACLGSVLLARIYQVGQMSLTFMLRRAALCRLPSSLDAADLGIGTIDLLYVY